jgi:hypothetical protein
MTDKDSEYGHASVEPIKDVDLKKLTFDGKKADLYINTGRLGGKHFLVRVADASGKPTLIAIHL